MSETFGGSFLFNLVVSEENLFASGYGIVYTFDINTGAILQECNETRAGFTFPAVEDNRMYLNANYWIYCLDVDTGETAWYHYVMLLDFLSYPIVIDGRVFVGGGRPVENIPQNPQSMELLDRARKYARRVMCLDAATGDIVWEFYASGRTVYSPAYFDNKIYVNTESQFVYCLDAETGELIWEKIIDWNSCAPLSLDGERIFVRTYEGIICLDIETGETLWKANSKSELYRTPSVAYNKVFGSADEILYCLDAQTGDIIWEIKAESHITTHVVVADKRAAFGTAKGMVYIVSANSGRLYDSVDLQYGTHEYQSEITALALSDGKLIVGQGGGRITCFEGSDRNLSLFIPIFAISALLVAILVLYRRRS
jgi:outer membrane protein assembly factor BamB